MSKVRSSAARTALDSSRPLLVEDHKVFVRFRRSFGASIFALALCWLQLSRIRRLRKTARHSLTDAERVHCRASIHTGPDRGRSQSSTYNSRISRSDT